jgi:hypothetical protein
MTNVVDLDKARLDLKAGKGFRNWKSRFGEDFGPNSRLDSISNKTLSFLAQGKGENSFYLYDLIINLLGLGSGFELNELNTKDKMIVMDRYLLLLDRIRFEYMKRLGWLEGYPGEEFTLIELVLKFDQLAPNIQAKPPILSRDHPDYPKFSKMNIFEREEFIRKLVPEALRRIGNHSTTL